MNLRDIEYFAVVSQHGHLGRAAEALGLGQPALSMSLRRLEKSAQAKLVKRTPKGVELTAVGAALLSHVSKLRLARADLAREVADLEPLADKFHAFGLPVAEVDGHDPAALQQALAEVRPGPRAVIARTCKGCGVSFMEGRMEWHYLPMNEEQYGLALQDLAGP